ncbi:MAG: hypothetical protein PHC64_00345 [Candidatus Gastranaerophilales bacterium]|nr:hypothetical protein [Candidatus Gastranaerophilales bacterium]
MQIVEIKNNLVRISYDTEQEKLVLAGFVVIKDSVQSFIGQIIHLEANANGNFGVVQLLFTFDDEGVITPYNGSIPDIKSLMDTVHPQELLELLPAQIPILLGEIAQQKTKLNIDRSFLEQKLLVCLEKEEDNIVLTKNLAKQLAFNGKKVLIIDLDGKLKRDSYFIDNTIVASEDFKLPLNYETINFIYEKGLTEATAETKALIQEIFLEVQNYVKTLPQKFIPFESFKDVVDNQYQETGTIELVLLKNKLLRYYEEGIFAQEKNEFETLKISLQQEEPTVFDLSETEENIQKEMISYVYSLISDLNSEIYVICNLENNNSDKKLLKQIFTTKNVYSTLICPYSYKYLKELKQLSRNLILFAPIQQQNDFARYNVFLSKLNAHEFIFYGQSTQHLPLIVKLEELEEIEEAKSKMQNAKGGEVGQAYLPDSETLDEEIKRDVDEIYTAPKTEEAEIDEEYDLTEDDLDFVEEIVNEETGDRGQETEEEANVPSLEIKDFGPSAREGQDVSLDASSHLSPLTSNSASPSPEEEAPVLEILPASTASTPIVPIYSADVEPKTQSDELEQGDVVTHPKYGKGTVEKLITYGNKTLCSINFDNVGRRLLDPTLVEIKRVDGE